ncbi:hypothetical protein NPX13_g108 [Xylaria arbuscula]|uniref:Uncharacterized protein n=1 Tax=Xylaria arbuscula TaxID=114810 RepID=A0A9W8TS52_9PEZI|nr:hypothetical protein NPX13_g108 [Xylaria arbuscula]
MERAWESTEECESYSHILRGHEAIPSACHARLQHQRPWHSKIVLPAEPNQEQGQNVSGLLESYDLDCLIVLVRYLISQGLTVSSLDNALLTCAMHDFGYVSQANYRVKGMLVSKLFPDHIEDIQFLQSQLTFENLLNHPAVKHLIQGSVLFALRDIRLLISDPSNPTGVETIEVCKFEDLMDGNEVRWDGTMPIGQTVAEQAYNLDRRAKNGTKYARRYCALPDFIRVTFTPREDHPRRFEDVQQFQLNAQIMQDDGPMTKEVTSDVRYDLSVVIKLDPREASQNLAEIRVYHANGKMVRPAFESRLDRRAIAGQKLKPDTKWMVGDPSLKFMMFYTKWDPPEDVPEEDLMTHLSLAEYRSPSPVLAYHLPFPDSPERRRPQEKDSRRAEGRGRSASDDDDGGISSESDKMIHGSRNHKRRTRDTIEDSDEEHEKDTRRTSSWGDPRWMS